MSTERPSDQQVVSTMLVGPRVPPALCKRWECPVSPPQPHGAHSWAYEAVVVSRISRGPIQFLKLFLCVTLLSPSPGPASSTVLSPAHSGLCLLNSEQNLLCSVSLHCAEAQIDSRQSGAVCVSPSRVAALGYSPSIVCKQVWIHQVQLVDVQH